MRVVLDRFRLAGFLFLCLTAAAVSLPAVRSAAAVVEAYDVGSGANTARLLIDFGFVGGDAYLFTYRYDGLASGEDLIRQVDAGGSLLADLTDFGSLGVYVDGFTLQGSGNAEVPGFGGDQGEVWTYWTSPTRPTLAAAWQESAAGPSSRVLTDGGYDGWTLNVSAFNDPANATNNPPAAVPEPATAAVLLGTLLTVTRRRRRPAA